MPKNKKLKDRKSRNRDRCSRQELFRKKARNMYRAIPETAFHTTQSISTKQLDSLLLSSILARAEINNQALSEILDSLEEGLDFETATMEDLGELFADEVVNRILKNEANRLIKN